VAPPALSQYAAECAVPRRKARWLLLWLAPNLAVRTQALEPVCPAAVG